MDIHILIVLVLSIISIFLSIYNLNNIYNLHNLNKSNKKGELYNNVYSSECNFNCSANNNLNPLILNLVPNPINIKDGVVISHNSSFNNTYLYISKGCQVQPITLVLTTYCSLDITNTSFLNSIFPFGLNQLLIENIFLSLEIFIDCKTLILSIKNLFVDISDGYGGTPKTQVNTGTEYDTLINSIIDNNSESINFQQPLCSFDLTTCNLSSSCNSQIDPSCCRFLVKEINSQIQQNLSSIPSVNISNSDAVTALNLICGN